MVQTLNAVFEFLLESVKLVSYAQSNKVIIFPVVCRAIWACLTKSAGFSGAPCNLLVNAGVATLQVLEKWGESGGIPHLTSGNIGGKNWKSSGEISGKMTGGKVGQ